MESNTAKAANKEPEFRKERKFVVEELGLNAVEGIVRTHPSMFSQVYAPRYVNNIYLDTPDLQHFNDNLVGSADRYKFRIRWYGEQFGMISKPVLEIKIKKGLAGSKMHFPLAPFRLDRDFSQEVIREVVGHSEAAGELKKLLSPLSPTLLNRYHRKYFHSANRKFRITIDSKLAFMPISRHQNCFMRRLTDYSKIILELKYDVQDDLEAGRVSGAFPFRLSKSSKYINGMQNLEWW